MRAFPLTEVNLRGPLTDGVIRLRLPSPAAGDIDAVRGYINQDPLDGGAGTVTQFVPGTGETFEDLRYVLEQQPAAGTGPA